jgi:hypothetical protein
VNFFLGVLLDMSEPALLLMHCCSSSSTFLYIVRHLSLLKRASIPTFFSIASIRKGCDTHAFSRNMERPRPVPDKQTWSLSSTQQTIYICWTSIMVRACCYFSGGFKKLVGINNSHHSLFSPNIYFVCLFV